MTLPPLLLVNFSHPLSSTQIEQITQSLGQPPDRVIDAPVQFDADLPFQAQVSALLAGLPVSAEAWQTNRILLVPPAFSPITALLLAELHGRMGYFPAIVRFKTLSEAQPPVFVLAEIINLQSLRDAARRER
jgi:hypothetical protein